MAWLFSEGSQIVIRFNYIKGGVWSIFSSTVTDRTASAALSQRFGQPHDRRHGRSICAAYPGVAARAVLQLHARDRPEPGGGYAAFRKRILASKVRLRHAHGEGDPTAHSPIEVYMVIDLVALDRECGMKWRVMVELGGVEGT